MNRRGQARVRPRRTLVVILTLCVMLGLACASYVGAQTQIVRTLPEGGGKTGTAQWGAPLPQAESARGTGEAEVSGRLSLGSQAGSQPDGATFTTVTTDSRMTLVQPLGSDSDLVLNAAALRRRSANDENENYGGDLSLQFDRVGFEIGGDYSARVRPVDETLRADSDGSLRAAASLAYLETLPIRLSYESTWTGREEDAVATEDSRHGEATLTATGTAGVVGVELDSAVSREDDRLETRETLGVGADLLVAIPAGERLVVQTGVSPNYNRSETPAATITTRSVEYGGGPFLSFSDDLQARLNVSRVDAWTEAPGLAAEDEHQVTWKGSGRLGYSPEEGLFGEAAYWLAKTVEGNSTHDVRLPAGFRGGDGVVGEVSESIAAKFVRSRTGETVSDSLDWGATVGLFPAEAFGLNVDYSGGYLREEGDSSTRHRVDASFTHTPDPLLSYRAAAALSNGQADAPQGVWQHEYRAGTTITIERRLRAYVFDLSETVTAETGGSDDLLSAASLTLGLPVFTGVGLRHATTWEWITSVEPEGPPGSQYRHSTGVSIAHETIPFSFDTEYAFSHGYRGQRHDVASHLFVPVGRGFGLDGAFTFSAYEDNDPDATPQDSTSRSPATFTLELVYEF